MTNLSNSGETAKPSLGMEGEGWRSLAGKDYTKVKKQCLLYSH